MTRIAAIAAALSASLVSIPAAWPCGGGGSSGGGSSGGGSSSGGGGGGSSGDYSSSSTVSEPACVETSDIHGHRTCSGYGSWRGRSVPIALELGFISGIIDMSGVEATGDIEHSGGTRYSYKVVSDDLGGDTAGAAGMAMRLLFHGRRFYGGLETGFAVIAADEVDHMAEVDGRAMLSPRATMSTTTAGVFGAKLFAGSASSMPLSFAGELAGGIRTISVTAESQLGACITSDTTVHAQPMVEARARADLWLSPRVTVGAWLGTDLVTELPSGGLVISSHLRAFDGAR